MHLGESFLPVRPSYDLKVQGDGPTAPALQAFPSSAPRVPLFDPDTPQGHSALPALSFRERPSLNGKTKTFDEQTFALIAISILAIVARHVTRIHILQAGFIAYFTGNVQPFHRSGWAVGETIRRVEAAYVPRNSGVKSG